MTYVKNVIKLSVVRETKEGAFLIYFPSPIELGDIALDPRPCFPLPCSRPCSQMWKRDEVMEAHPIPDMMKEEGHQETTPCPQKNGLNLSQPPAWP